MLVIILMFILGLSLVIKGGDWFVDSSVNIAKISGLPEIFIGATIVSLATTSPELLVSATASYKGYTTMSVGNSLGSMICNMGLILGFLSILKPSNIHSKVFKIKSLILLSYTAILFILSLNKYITKKEGLFLLVLLIFYIIINSLILKKEKRIKSKLKVTKRKKTIISIKFIIGILAIIIGSNLLVNNGVLIAEMLKVPEAIISLTLIALGTSLPELVTAISAFKKGNTSISTGNIIGANILNGVLVLGVSSLISPLKILNQNLSIDYLVVFILTLILIIPSLKLKKVTRIQGILLFSIYILYLIVLYLVYLS
ncbi:MAG: calcium/sodium antiporter [Firmicutes bacterium]|nr:calcium/sodium antiporter [Bacillota bacterium]